MYILVPKTDTWGNIPTDLQLQKAKLIQKVDMQTHSVFSLVIVEKRAGPSACIKIPEILTSTRQFTESTTGQLQKI